jgi:hypothetical protein
VIERPALMMFSRRTKPIRPQYLHAVRSGIASRVIMRAVGVPLISAVTDLFCQLDCTQSRRPVPRSRLRSAVNTGALFFNTPDTYPFGLFGCRCSIGHSCLQLSHRWTRITRSSLTASWTVIQPCAKHWGHRNHAPVELGCGCTFLVSARCATRCAVLTAVTGSIRDSWPPPRCRCVRSARIAHVRNSR